MGTIAIAANPNSGKDIRRLVTHATVIDNAEKVNILRRVVSGIAHLGDHRVVLMPDRYQLGKRALQGLPPESIRRSCIHSMPVTDTQQDTTRFVADMTTQQHVDVVIVLGGDGTSRAAAKSIGDIPLIAVSTGTNNVYPAMLEGTSVAMAACAIAQGSVSHAKCGVRGKQIELLVGEEKQDVALIDAVFSTLSHTGARAVLDQQDIDWILVTQCHPASIGFSALAGSVRMVAPEDDVGFYLKPDWRGTKFTAAISAGIFARFSVADSQVVPLDHPIVVRPQYDGTIALDGEREMTFRSGEKITLRITRNGPRKVDIMKTVHLAAQAGRVSSTG